MIANREQTKGRDQTFQHFQVDLWEPGYIQEVVGKLNEYGFATFDRMASPEELVALSRNFGDIIMHRDADERGVTKVAPKKIDQNLSSPLGFTNQELRLHCDGTAVENPAKFLALYCSVPAQDGGTTMLLDGKKLFMTLKEEDPDLLEKLQTPNSAIFGNPLGEHYIGSVFQRNEDGVIMVRFRRDNAGYYAAPLAKRIERLTEIMDHLAIKFDLAEGQGYIVNNNQALHARTSFTGNREMYRVLINDSLSSPVGQQVPKGFRV